MSGFSAHEVIAFVIGALAGGIPSWFIAKHYDEKTTLGIKAELAQLKNEMRANTTLADFEKLIRNGTWTKQHVGHIENWIADSDNTVQIEIGNDSVDYREHWTENFPDRNAFRYPVYLKINGNIIKELAFIALDGGRYFVPMTELRSVSNGKYDHFWDLNSLDVAVFRIVGRIYRDQPIEAVAANTGVNIVP